MLVDPSGLWQQPVDAQAPAAAVSSPGNGFGPVDADCIPSRSQYAGPASLYDVWAAGYVAGCTAITIIAAAAKATIECAQSLRCVATNAILFAAGGGIGRLGLALGERAIAGRVGLGLTPRSSVAAGERGVARAGSRGTPSGPAIHSRYRDSTPVYEGQQPARITGPDLAAGGPHSRIRWDNVNSRVYQSREFDAVGNPIRDIDFTRPTYPNGIPRPGHYVPEQHRWHVNDPAAGPSSGFRRGPGQPLP